MVEFKFIFDFGSPKAYLVYNMVPGIEERTGVKADYVPVLLGGIFKSTNNVSPIEAFKTAYTGGRSYSEGILDDLKTSRGSESAFRGLQGKRIEEIKEENRKLYRSISQKIINGRFCRNDNCN